MYFEAPAAIHTFLPFVTDLGDTRDIRCVLHRLPTIRAANYEAHTSRVVRILYKVGVLD